MAQARRPIVSEKGAHVSEPRVDDWALMTKDDWAELRRDIEAVVIKWRALMEARRLKRAG